MTGREIKMKKEILEPEADLFPKKTGKKKGKIDGEREREGSGEEATPPFGGKGLLFSGRF